MDRTPAPRPSLATSGAAIYYVTLGVAALLVVVAHQDITKVAEFASVFIGWERGLTNRRS